jgi:hypothetical protein
MIWKQEWYSRLFGLVVAILLPIIVPHDSLPASLGPWRVLVLVACGFGIGAIVGRCAFALQEQVRKPRKPHTPPR